ncbi:MAG: tetratricopeptide repeat protein [Pseudomonadota bacterium]
MSKKWILLVAVPILAAAVVVGAMLALSPEKTIVRGTVAGKVSKVRGKIAGLPETTGQPTELAAQPGEFTLKVARLEDTLEALDRWSGGTAEAGGQPPPSAQVGAFLGGTDWIDRDRAIVARARLGADVMEARVLIPFTKPSENFLVIAGKFGKVTTGPDYYLFAFPPTAQVSGETAGALETASRELPREAFTLDLSPASLMAAAKPLIDQQINAMAQAPPAAPGTPPAASPEQLRNMMTQVETMAAQVATLSLGLDLTNGDLKVAMAANPVEGSPFAEFLQKNQAGKAESILGGYRPQGQQSVFRTLPYNMEGFLDWMGGLYAKMGIDISAFRTVAGQMTGETVAGFSMKDKRLSLEGIMVLKNEMAPDDPFLDNMTQSIFAYMKSMDDFMLKQQEKPPFLMGDLLVRLPDGKVGGLRTVGFRMKMPDLSQMKDAQGQPVPPIPFEDFQVRFTVVGNKLVTATGDDRLAGLVAQARGLEDSPAQGAMFAGTMDLGSMMASMMPQGLAPATVPENMTLSFEADMEPGRAWASYSFPMGRMMAMAGGMESGAAPESTTVAQAPTPVPAPAPVSTASEPMAATAEARPAPVSARPPLGLEPPRERRPVEQIIEQAELAAIYGGDKAAARYYKKALDKAPDNAEARFGLALALADRGDYGKALEAVNMALEKDPQNANFLYGRARIHLLSGNKDAAMVDFAMAAQAGSQDALAYLSRVRAS